LVTAFGLRDSVGGVGTLQYEKVVEYSSRAYIKEITTDKQRDGLDTLLSGRYLYIREESVDAKNNGGGLTASLIVPETPEKLNAYINLRSRKSGKIVPLTSGGVVITEKLARVMGVSPGGSFDMTTSDGRTYTAQITGIAENYVLHFVFMPPDVYTDLFGAEPLFNGILSIPESDREFAETLLTNDNVRAVVNTAGIRENINDSTDALKIVAVVLIILACALAFVVLFNLTNINITERIRELATIKVLGFYDTELAMYIYRENGIVTAMGIVLGLIGGIWLHRFVLTAAEIDLLMFPHIIEPQSYVLSVILSVVFAVFVNLVMSRKLVGIDMVESLKNVE
ncbi:MAG: ABC transporter permease, partial [Oscillospiraceae bacterium]|nr:ABC transporter permease [Oscillospiraceae bacterium]